MLTDPSISESVHASKLGFLNMNHEEKRDENCLELRWTKFWMVSLTLPKWNELKLFWKHKLDWFCLWTFLYVHTYPVKTEYFQFFSLDSLLIYHLRWKRQTFYPHAVLVSGNFMVHWLFSPCKTPDTSIGWTMRSLKISRCTSFL